MVTMANLQKLTAIYKLELINSSKIKKAGTYGKALYKFCKQVATQIH